MKKFKSISILMMLSLTVLLIASCGGSGGSEAPVEEADPGAETSQLTEEEESDESSAGDESDISPEFKATMDSYEEFFDEYVEFMEKYNENPSDTELLLELSNMMTKEADMLNKLNEMDESEMTTAEAAYYLEVTARINEKLASVL